MRNARNTPIGTIGAIVAGLLLSGNVAAQKGMEPLPDIPPPPKLSSTPVPADEAEANTVTIRQDGDTKVEEFRTRGGRIYAIRVTPAFGKPYVMVDPDGKGMTNAAEINGGVHPSQWTIFEF